MARKKQEPKAEPKEAEPTTSSRPPSSNVMKETPASSNQALEKLVQKCAKATSAGLSTASLPAKAIAEVAGMLAAAKPTEGPDTSADRHRRMEPGTQLEPTFLACRDALPEIPRSLLMGTNSPDAPLPYVSEVAKRNAKAALGLASICFRTAAASLKACQGSDDALPDGLWSFLHRALHIAQSGVLHKASGELTPPGEVDVEDCLRELWLSGHAMVAAASYSATLTARRLIRLLAQHVGMNQTSLGKEAEAFFLTVLAVGESGLPELCWEVWSEASRSAYLQQNQTPTATGQKTEEVVPLSSSGTPSVATRILLRAVCNSCLAKGVHLATNAAAASSEVASLLTESKICAEQLSASLMETMIRQCLLAEDSGCTSLLEQLVSDLAIGCSQVEWPSAPTLLLSLSKGLRSVATASRSAEIPFHKREFATKMLAKIAVQLTKDKTEAQAAGKAALQASERELANLKFAGQPSTSSTTCKGSSQSKQLLARYISAGAVPRTSQGASAAPMVELHALLSDLSTTANTPLLLCSYLATQPGANESSTAGAEKSKRPSKRKGEDKPDTSRKVATELDWVGAAFAACVASPAALRCGEPSQLSASIDKQARLLYMSDMYAVPDSTAARTLCTCLETIMTVLGSSPFAFVRRQAASGLGQVCDVSPSLVMTKKIMEAISVALKDDSPLVRGTTVDLLGRLLMQRQMKRRSRTNHAEALPDEVKIQIQAAIRVMLNDSVPSVRKAAFRVECDALHPAAPQLLNRAADLLKQIRLEEEAVRQTVLNALERALLPPPPAEATLSHLAALAVTPGVGHAGLLDVLRAHKQRSELQTFHQVMIKIAAGAAAEVDAWHKAPSAEEDPAKWALVLVQVASVCPEACYALLKDLHRWLQDGPSPAQPTHAKRASLVQHAGRVLSEALPSWAASSSIAKNMKGRLGRALVDGLLPWLNEPQQQNSAVTRSVVECLCVVSCKVLQDSDCVLALAREAVLDLQEATAKGVSASAQAKMLHQMLVLSTIAEFLDPDDAAHAEIAEVTCRLLQSLFAAGSSRWKAIILPCLGFALRGHHSLLVQSESGLAKQVLDTLRLGLEAGGDGKEDALLLCSRSAEALTSVLGAYEKRLLDRQAAADDGGESPSRLCEAVQALASLQDAILPTLGMQNVVAYSLEALQSFQRLGVLHPAAVLPGLLSVCLAGSPTTARKAQGLLLSIATAAPALFLSRLGAGLQASAKRLCSIVPESTAVPEEGDAGLLTDSWRFSALSAVCSECFETLRLRLQLVEALINEVLVVADLGSGKKELPTGLVASPASKEGAAMVKHLTLLAELAAGSLAFLPLRSEAEVGSILRMVSDFISLEVAPILLEPEAPSASSEGSTSMPLFAKCTVAVFLHAVCSHLCRNAGEMTRLLRASTHGDTGDKAPVQRAAGGKALPPFGRLRAELMQTEGRTADVLRVLAEHIPSSSPLIRGVHSSATSPPSNKNASVPTPVKAEKNQKRRSSKDENAVSKVGKKQKTS
mmetsp:Transcript_6660/g.14543  ORF Transcript_6660/g.14543 Transcript_6660/m.14543 type:complete len:1503 (-) Transcript_6660:97-4605(-)